jgi:hypothetical protein
MAQSLLIRQNMEVLGSDGSHVGTVEQIQDSNRIKLASDDPEAGGESHYIPITWVRHAEIKVHLRRTGEEARAQWSTH